MSGADAQTHGDHSQWAETSHCRVAGVRRFGSFAAVELIAPRVARRAAPGQFVMVTVPGGGFLLRRHLVVRRHGGRVRLLVEARVAAASGSPSSTSATAWTSQDRWAALPHRGVTNAARRGRHRLRLSSTWPTSWRRPARVTAAFGFRDFRSARAQPAPASIGRLGRHRGRGVGRRARRCTCSPALDVAPGTTVCACGPADARRCSSGRSPRLRGYVSLEAHMACGTGSCHGCVVDTARGKVRVCSEGPVFRLDEVNA
jgi:hypothetical protein